MTGAALLARLRHRVVTDLWTRPAGNLAALDGLRCFACASVVLFHCTLFTGALSPHHRTLELRFLRLLGNGGWSGVDVFFVLSGFLIGRMLIRELTTAGQIDYTRFYLRRSFRIFPAYYLVLTVAVFVISRFNIGNIVFFSGARSWEQLRGGAWTNYVYLNNYIHAGEPNVLSWGWSLCVEEHFYLLLPALLTITFRSRSARVRTLLLLCCVGLPVLGRAVQYLLDPSIVLAKTFYYYSHNRFDETFTGVLIANLYVVHREPFERLARRLGSLLWVVGLGCILAVWLFGGVQYLGLFPVVGQFLLMSLGAGLLVVNGLFLDNRATRFLALPLWYPLARVSYVTYLIHPFVLFWALTWFRTALEIRQIGIASLLGLFLLVMTVSTLLAAVTFLVLERPLLDYGIRVGRRLARSTPARGH